MGGVRSRRSRPLASLAGLVVAFGSMSSQPALAQTVLVARGSVWSFLDDGSDPGAAWREPVFDDSGWNSGPAELGYGDGDEQTAVRCTADPVCPTGATEKFVTTYFRTTFEVPDPAALGLLDLSVLRDDGAAVYLNGAKVFRSHLPCGAITAATLATATVAGADETTWVSSTLASNALVAGTNLLAVEIHQASPASSDISFDLELAAASSPGPTPFPTPAPGVTRFAAIGDYGAAGQPEADVAALVRSWRPEFVITLGDNNYDSGSASTIDANIGQYYQEFIRPYAGCYGSGSADVNRFFPSLGNHDWLAPGAVPYLDYFALPGNERYYRFGWGPVDLFALDSDPSEPDGIASGSVQGQWLQVQLAGSSAAWKLVYFHHPPYSSGLHGPTSALQWPFRAWGATVVLSGHDHTYERLEAEGLPYFVNGLGGRSIYSFPTVHEHSRFRYNEDYGAMLVEAATDWIEFRFFSRTGQQVDSYRLPGAAATATSTPDLTRTATPVVTLTPSWTATPAASASTGTPAASPTTTPAGPTLPAGRGLPTLAAAVLLLSGALSAHVRRRRSA